MQEGVQLMYSEEQLRGGSKNVNHIPQFTVCMFRSYIHVQCTSFLCYTYVPVIHFHNHA